MASFHFQITEFSGDTRYLSAVGRIRELEKQLIPFQKFIRMADRPDWQGVLDELRSTDYYENLVAVHNAKMLEQVIAAVLANRQRVVRELSVDSQLIEAILLRQDFNNLKIYLKKQWLNVQPAFPYSHLSLWDWQKLEKDLQNRQPLPGPLQPVFLKVWEDYEQNKSLFRAEMLIDKAYLENVRQLFEQSGIPFLKVFIRYRIDWMNILYLLRWRKWDSEGRVNWSLLPEGGYLDRHQLQRLMSEPLERLPTIFQFTPYGEFLSSGMEFFRQTGQLWQLEKSGEDYLTTFCQLTRYTNAGIEPLIAFIWVSIQELKNLHMILTAKYMGLSPEIIKTRIRRVYA